MSYPTINQEKIINTIIEYKNNKNLHGCIHFLEQTLSNSENELTEDPIFLSKLHNELGLCYFYNEDYEKVEQEYLKAVLFNNENINALYNLADFYFQTKQFEKSIEMAEAIEKLNNTHTPSIYLTGLCYSCLGNPEKALLFFKKTTMLDPNSKGGNYWTGECYLYLKDYANALPYFKKSYEMQPNHLDSVRGYAISLLETNNPEKSIALCEKVSEQNPMFAVSMYQIHGEALIKLQDFKNAGMYHTKLALLELDARDYLVQKTGEIIKEYGTIKAKEYSEEILTKIPELEASFQKLFENFTIHKKETF